jgi:uncharacterized protein
MIGMFSYNVFEQGSEILLAICDYKILDKTFESGTLTITVSEFYKGKECTEKKAVELANKATIINAVGNEIIKLLINKNIIKDSNVLKIGSVLHAQVISLKS